MGVQVTLRNPPTIFVPSVLFCFVIVTIVFLYCGIIYVRSSIGACQVMSFCKVEVF